jgi:uncharacterized membrane protein
MIEAHFLVPVVLEETRFLQGNWRKLLAEDLLMPSYKMSRVESIGRRLKRNYIWIFLVVLGSWAAKVALASEVNHESVTSWHAFLASLGEGIEPRWVPIAVFFAAVVEVGALLVWALSLREYSGDIGPRRRDTRAWRV